jgi:hypothetical protein
MNSLLKHPRKTAKAQNQQRFALIATPRSGNTWVKVLLGKIYDLPEIETFSLNEDDWTRISGPCILQIHIRREPAIEARLKREGFRILTVARHPFDVLISILRFAVFANTTYWLRGAGGDERSILGLTPNSDAVLAYARSPRAEQLFGVSVDWRQAPGTHVVRYEDLVAAPANELRKAIEWMGPPRGDSVDKAVGELTMEHMKLWCVDSHVWLGRPGLWRELIVPQRAYELADALQIPLREFGYRVDPDPELTSEAADRRWAAYVGKEVADTIADRIQLRVQQRAATAAMNASLKAELVETRERMLRLQAFVDSRLQDVSFLGRFALQVARVTQAAMNRFPRAAWTGKRMRLWFERKIS